MCIHRLKYKPQQVLKEKGLEKKLFNKAESQKKLWKEYLLRKMMRTAASEGGIRV